VNQSEQINELAAALAKAQGEFISPPRNRAVEVKMRENKGVYKFCYATLDCIMDMIRKPLSDNGLSVAHSLLDDAHGPICETRIMHASGQWIATWVPVIVSEHADAQGWGAAITYARRYGLTCLLGIASDEDDDGNAACGNSVTDASRNQPSKPTTQPSKKAAPAKQAPPPAKEESKQAAAGRDIDAAANWGELCGLVERVNESEFEEKIKTELLAKLHGKMHAKLLAEVGKIKEAKLDSTTKMINAIWPDETRMEALSAIQSRRDNLKEATVAA